VVAPPYGARVSRSQIGHDRLGDLQCAGVCPFQARALAKHSQAETFLVGSFVETMTDRYRNAGEVRDERARAGTARRRALLGAPRSR
jgi:hypothetical protein